MFEFSERKAVSFRCSSCEGPAEINAVDGRLDSVVCTPCGISVDGDDARSMHRVLAIGYVSQVGRNLNRGLTGQAGTSPGQVTNEFSDPA